MGCQVGFHRGHPKESQLKFCLHHGEPNPDSKYPDSFCGKPFLYKDTGKKGGGEILTEEPCLFHSGHYKVSNPKTGDGRWTCCNEDAKDAKPCREEHHYFAEWPDEDAKKYFFDKPLKNPSTQWKEKQTKTDFELFGRYSGYFRQPEPYVEKNPGRPPQLSPDE